MRPSGRRRRGRSPETITASVDGARGAMIVLHGGSWRATGDGEVRLLRDAVTHFNALGLTTLIPRLRAGAQGLDDLVAVVGAEADRRGESVCLYGESSGGHLALVAAALAPDAISCVVAAAAPTSLVDYPRDSPGHRGVAAAAERAFAGRDLRLSSPVDLAPRIRADVLLLVANDDPMVPRDQADRLAAQLPGTPIVTIARGPVPWVHAEVDGQSLRRAAERVDRFVLDHLASGEA